MSVARRSWGLILIAVIAVAVVSAAATVFLARVGLYGDEVAGSSRLGVTRAANGGVQVSYLGCDDELFESAELRRASTAGGDGAALWLVEARHPATGRQDVQVGSDDAPGFRLRVDEIDQLPESGTFYVVVKTSSVASIPLTFEMPELEEGEFLVQGGRMVSEESLVDRREQACG